jgi:hypothetical protein
MMFNIWVSGFCLSGAFHSIIMGNYVFAIMNFVLAALNLLVGMTR